MSEVRAHAPPAAAPPRVVVGAGEITPYLEDASGLRGGRAAGVIRPASEAEIAAWLRATSGPLLAQGARSSLTGGAVPFGETVLATERLDALSFRGDRADVGAGVGLDRLQAEARARGLDYPPIPTFRRACIGATVSTNAGGAASFRHGPTRPWVEALRLVLDTGDVLDVVRGEHVAPAGGAFRVTLSDGRERVVPLPSTYRTPPLRKVSAGYFVADETDLIDLLIGAEGTLGVISRVTVRLAPAPERETRLLALLDDEPRALGLTDALRDVAAVRSIEWIDRASLALVAGPAERLGLPVADRHAAALVVETHADETPVIEEILRAGVDADDVLVAPPGETRAARAIERLRELVPEMVNEAGGGAHRKIAGDPIVPIDRLEEAIGVYREAFRTRGLEPLVWGHISDGNVHPNAVPRSADEVARGEEALLEIADAVLAMGGCPLSEHGVGRNRLKQEMLRRMFGDAAIEEMRAVKRAFDPAGRFSPGVLLGER